MDYDKLPCKDDDIYKLYPYIVSKVPSLGECLDFSGVTS